MSVAQLTEATGGKLLRGNPEAVVDSFVINTRVLQPDGVFFALKGTRTDGHKFLREATKKRGAAAVIMQAPAEDAAAPPALIQVEETAAALGKCGRWVRQRLDKAKWLSLTGSNGKTSTKELIAEALAATHRVHRTQGNLNNHLGVPLSMLACPDDAEWVVLELAMSASGEIAELSQMTDPDVGLVTNVRAVHLENFSSLDDIAAAKGELFACLRDDAVAVVNLDDVNVRVQAARHIGPRVTFGRHPQADLHLEDVVNRFIPGAGIVVRHQDKTYRAQLQMGGAHSAYNALAAMAAVVAVGGDLVKALERMEQLKPGAGRGRVSRLERDMTLIDDSYNSSPAALASVLETLKASPAHGRKVLVMGDMLELGVIEGALHREAGKRAAAAGVQLLITVGPLSRQSAESGRRAGVPEVHQYTDANQCAQSLTEYLQSGDMIVIKGSRGMRMERVVDALTHTFKVVA